MKIIRTENVRIPWDVMNDHVISFCERKIYEKTVYYLNPYRLFSSRSLVIGLFATQLVVDHMF